jgi:CheY-like chemotaxis protein
LRPEPGSPPGFTGEKMPDRKKTILVVDSTASTLLLLKEEFEEAGYQVLIAPTGSEALEILNDPSGQVDLVVTNLRHPGLAKLEFIRFIKKNWPGLPVICHTALSGYDQLPPSDRPFDALVEKSFDLTKLKASVAELLGQKA